MFKEAPIYMSIALGHAFFNIFSICTCKMINFSLFVLSPYFMWLVVKDERALRDIMLVTRVSIEQCGVHCFETIDPIP